MTNLSSSYSSIPQNALTTSFTRAILTLTAQSKTVNRRAYAQLRQDIATMGGVYAVKRMLSKNMAGYVPVFYADFYMADRKDLLIEAVVLDPKYSALFTEEELAFCHSLFLGEAA